VLGVTFWFPVGFVTGGFVGLAVSLVKAATTAAILLEVSDMIATSFLGIIITLFG
jgi:hypothetical protein